MGSGGVVVMDDATCMVDTARFFTIFPWRNPAENARPAVKASR